MPGLLLLLPPSEGKALPSAGPPLDLDALFAADALGALRQRIVRAVDPALLHAPAAPAAEVYTGVLYDRLGLATLTPAARRRAAQDVLIVSGLWGLIRPDDRIPHYKLPIATKVPRLRRGLAALWKPAVATALAERDVDGELVVDLRSGSYAAVWRPRLATHLAVRSFRVAPDGTRTVVSHNVKVARGDVARAVLRARRAVRTPQDVAAAAAAAGLRVELGDGTLDVLE